MMPGRPLAALLVALALGLGGCGGGDDAVGPGETSVSEAKALDEAAEIIESRRPPEPVVSPTGPLPPGDPPQKDGSVDSG